MSHVNILQAQFQYDESDPQGYRCGVAAVGQLAGAKENAVKLFELPPAQHLCPYHYEYVEEWLLVLEGSLELRTPGGVETVARGALVCFPIGPDGAHKLTNSTGQTAVALMWSSSREPSVAVYPDSAKVGVWAGDDEVMLRRSDGNVDYYDGET